MAAAVETDLAPSREDAATISVVAAEVTVTEVVRSDRLEEAQATEARRRMATAVAARMAMEVAQTATATVLVEAAAAVTRST